MARKKKHSRLSPAPVCGIEPALHQRYSDGCWCATLPGKWNHRRSSAPTLIWIQPKSSRTSQSDGKWRCHFSGGAPPLGVETQRQWSKNAVARTTPALLGLYSLVCLWAQQALESNRMSYAAAWYEKTNFTFSGAIAVIRCEIFLSHSPPDRECDKNQSRLLKRLLYALCFPA